jgi:ATP-binding cassette, subfamily B, bacterial
MKKNNIKSIFWRYRFYLLLLILLSIVANIANLYVPRLVGEAVDKAINSKGLESNFVIVIVTTIIIGLVFSLSELGFGIFFSETFAKNIRIESFNNLTKQPFKYVLEKGSSNLITLFSSDVENIQENFTTSLSYLLQSFILLGGSITLMFITNWQLALVAILSLPFVIGTFFVSISKVGKFFNYSQKNLTVLNNTVSENINASNLVRVLASFGWENKKFENFNNQSKLISINILKIFSFLLPVISLITTSMTLLFLYLGGIRVVSNNLTVGQLTSFLGYYALLITPIFILGFTSQGLSQAFTSWKRIEPIINANLEEKEGEYKPFQLDGLIELRDITLEFDGKKVLDNVSFVIKPNSNTAIIGPTSAGKSQLLSILVGLSQPTSGHVLFDNIDIKDWNRELLLSKIGICFQESLIFNNSIRENITLNRDVTDKQIQIAIESANLKEFIDSLEDGLETKIYERGANLSGGQKQRLTLARALVTSPDLLLLDDFTARVDLATEESIRKAIVKNYPETQLIQVCQKIETLKHVDHIIVMMEGQMVGQGTHEELLQSNSEYQQIYQSQQTI